MAEREYEHEEYDEVDGEYIEDIDGGEEVVDEDFFDEDDEVEEVDSEFFEMHGDEEYEEYSENRASVSWGAVLSVVAALILAVALCVVGGRALFAAQQDTGITGKTWVIEGSFVDVTPDLETKDNVARYKGTLPVDERIDGKTYRSNLKDRQKVSRGEEIEFRGSQTGIVSSDFPREVSALLVETGDNQLEVIRTGEKGSLHEVDEGTVGRQKLIGWVSFIGALLVLIGGGYVGVILTRRARQQALESEYEGEEDLELD